MSERLNFYSGTFSLDPQNAEQIKADLADFTADLASIEYIADIHARREDIVKVLNAVRIRYAAELDGDDFLQTISATDQTTDLESIRTYQDVSERDNVLSTTDIRSFDMNYSGEIVGRMPTQLRGKFETYNDTGADSFKFGSSRSTVLTVTEAGASATTGSMDATFNSVSEDVPDLVSLTSGYDNLNLMAGAVARALSSQFPNSNNDQNLLKILVEQASYENLMKIALGGCTTTTGSTVSIQSLLHSNTVAKGHGINMRDLKDKVFDENLPSSRALGHEILLAIFDKCPASLGDDSGAGRTVSYLGEDNTTTQRPWQIVSLVGTDQDGLKLEYAANLINQATGNKIDITLQFVLKTKLTMTLRDGTSLQTLESPASSGDGSGSGSGAAEMTDQALTPDALSYPRFFASVTASEVGSSENYYPTTRQFYFKNVPGAYEIVEGTSPGSGGVSFPAYLQVSGLAQVVNEYKFILYTYNEGDTEAPTTNNFGSSADALVTRERKWTVIHTTGYSTFSELLANGPITDPVWNVVMNTDLRSADNGDGGLRVPHYAPSFASSSTVWAFAPSLGADSYRHFTGISFGVGNHFLGPSPPFGAIYAYLDIQGTNPRIKVGPAPSNARFYRLAHNGTVQNYVNGSISTDITKILIRVDDPSPASVVRNSVPGKLVKWAYIQLSSGTAIKFMDQEIVTLPSFVWGFEADTHVAGSQPVGPLFEYGSDINDLTGTTDYTGQGVMEVGLAPLMETSNWTTYQYGSTFEEITFPSASASGGDPGDTKILLNVIFDRDV